MAYGSGSRCAVPGCPWCGKKAKRAGVQRSFFVIRRPDLAKTPDEKKHRQSLNDFILRLRGQDEHDTIRMQLWKERSVYVKNSENSLQFACDYETLMKCLLNSTVKSYRV